MSAGPASNNVFCIVDRQGAGVVIGPPAIVPASPAQRSWALLLLAVVYAVNFIDRQIVSVLALDIKRDLGLNDADLGFLYGTAFGVFYALFGIPMGRLADSWNRVRMITLGLAFWSAMTAASGFARSGTELGIARIGVGVGEATASPCAYSLISDYYPKKQRATALALYSSGMYLGSGISLLIGAVVLTRWNAAFPTGWHGFVGWQASFLVIGIPGLLLAVFVSRLREPQRGALEGIPTAQSPHPFREFFQELFNIVPPLTLLAAAQRGTRALLANLLGLGIIIGLAVLLIRVTGDRMQWAAVGTGAYAVFSWVTALRDRDRPAYALTWGTPAFVALLIGYGAISFINYAMIFWSLPYAESVLGATKTTAALLVGGGSAAGGFIGLNFGGRIADRLRQRNPSGRILVIMFAALGPVLPFLISFTSGNLTLFYLLVFPINVLASLGLAASAATSQDLVLPRMRGQATAAYFLSITMIGLALGPYAVGRISASTRNLGGAILCVLAVVPVAAISLMLVYRWLPQAEASLLARARRAGEIL